MHTGTSGMSCRSRCHLSMQPRIPQACLCRVSVTPEVGVNRRCLGKPSTRRTSSRQNILLLLLPLRIPASLRSTARAAAPHGPLPVPGLACTSAWLRHQHKSQECLLPRQLCAPGIAAPTFCLSSLDLQRCLGNRGKQAGVHSAYLLMLIGTASA